jgi:peptide methionine sulfoxide reductase MsrB
MTERSEYTHDHLAPDRDLHLENLEQEEREITRRTSALAVPSRSHYEHRHALYWSDVVTDLLDDMSESDAAELEACGWPALMETLEEQLWNARNP